MSSTLLPAAVLPPESACWGKWEETTGRWHPLWAHGLDVAAVLATLLGPGGVIARPLAGHLGLPRGTPIPERLLAELLYLAILHDAGKTNRAFQNQLRAERRAPNRGHVRPFLAAWSQQDQPGVRSWVHRALRGLNAGTEGVTVLREAVCHHGRPYGPARPGGPLAGDWRPGRTSYHPGTALDELLRLAMQTTGLVNPPADCDGGRPAERSKGPGVGDLQGGARQLIAGALTLADWIGSSPEHFPMIGEPGKNLESPPDEAAYWDFAQERAKTICRHLGLYRPLTNALTLTVPPGHEAADLTTLFPSLFASGQVDREGLPNKQPTPVQQYLAMMPLDSGLYILESETGSGKTEAALTLYARLRAAGLVDGLVFALPTRATTLAMYDRVSRFLQTLHAGEAPGVVLAVGGRQQGGVPTTSGERGVLPATDSYRFSIEDDATRTATALQWASSSSKRYLAGEFVVGTIDQVLLAGLTVPHAHMRLAALARHLIVVDEVHAYDRYMTEVLANLLRYHVQGHGSALLMSATLASSARQDYDLADRSRDLEEEGREERQNEEVQAPYPALWHQRTATDAMTVQRLAAPPSLGLPLDWSMTDAEKSLAAAIAGARGGGRVLVLRNTVGAARATIDRIAEIGGGDLLWRPLGGKRGVAYHSRYSGPDRQLLDQGVLAAFGRGTPNVGTILVATQVVEQSLDLDFDMIVTDLAPVDLLLQRAGRLHRHRERLRPSMATTRRLLVVGPRTSEGFTGWVGAKGQALILEQSMGWGTVYSDLADLELTRRLILSRPRVHIPVDNRQLVESVYHPARREWLRKEGAWGLYLDACEGRDSAQRQNGARMRLDFRRSYADLAEDYDSLTEADVRTRLGDDRIIVRLGQPVPSYHGQSSVSEVAVPHEVLMRIGGPIPDLLPPELILVGTEQTTITLSPRLTLRYNADGWHW